VKARSRGCGRWGRGALLTLVALLFAACASSSRGAPATPSAQPSPTPLPAATLAAGAPDRWGYDPSKPTGLVDPPSHFDALPAGYRIETVVSGLRQPTAIAFAPDGTLLVAEQSGAIRVVKNGRLQAPPLYKLPSYTPASPEGFSELGLVGLTADPDFSQNGYVYAYYSTMDPNYRTVLARITDEDGRGTDLREIFSLDLGAPPCCHIAGSLRFASDGTLFVMVGDHQQEAAAQNVGSPFGKILRINPDGTAPPDNPFVNDPQADPRVYAYGLRNPYDIAIDPKTRRVFATENGFIGQDAIIEVMPGANYGWPGYSLSLPLDQIAAPMLFYHNAIGPSGMEFYRGAALPALGGALLFCQFHQGGALHAVRFDVDGTVVGDSVIAPGCTSDVLAGPDGFVYFVDYIGGVVYRIAKGQ
jgi:glucose/arabinose dehydrogenase